MKIEDRTKKKVSFASLEIGDVFEFEDDFYMKVNPVYAIDPISHDSNSVKAYAEDVYPANAYNLNSPGYTSIPGNVEVQTVRATLVIG